VGSARKGAYVCPDFQVLGIVESILKNPSVYIAEGSFLEAMAYLDGYFAGLYCSSNPEKQQEGRQWNQFKCWLWECHVSEKNHVKPWDIVMWLRQTAFRDEELLIRMGQFWVEFQADWEQGWRWQPGEEDIRKNEC
jgi:hypothetical protein